MVGTMSFLGFGSGEDLNSIVDALVQARRIRYIQPLETWKTEWETKNSVIDEINSHISALYSCVRGMDTLSEFLVNRVTSSYSNIVSATSSSNALTGSYSVTVGSNISHRLASSPISDITQPSSITYNVAGGTRTYSGPDIDGLIAAINSDASAGVTAELSGTGTASDPYRLILTSSEGGSANRITVTSATNLDFNASVGDVITGFNWSGGIITSGGTYTGSVNKTFSFEITKDGTVGTDQIEIAWKDSDGNKGTIKIDSSTTFPIEVFQGVTIDIAAGEPLVKGDTFTINALHPDLQAGQDDGLAKAARLVHSGFNDTNMTPVTNTAGSITYTYNGKTITIAVQAGATLEDVKNLINNDSNNPGITANIINDGLGTSSSYHLVLNGKNTGAAFQITDVDFSGLDNFFGTFDETQRAQNAMIKVDGYPPGSAYMQSASNEVANVIQGLTLELKDVGTAQISVGTDVDAIMDKIDQFVELFNNMRAIFIAATKYDAENERSAIFQGNYGINITKSTLDAMMSSGMSGFLKSDLFSTMTQLGFSTDTVEGSSTQGLIILDRDVLRQAIFDNPDAVTELFTANLKGEMPGGTGISFLSTLLTATPGVYDVEIDMDSKKGRFKLENGAWGQWYDLSGTDGNYRLTGMAGPERGIELFVSLDSTATGIHTSTLRLKTGLMPTMSAYLEKSVSPEGSLNIIKKNYQDIIKNIEKRIEAEEKRLTTYQNMLIQRYANLDTRLNEMNSKLTQISNLASQLSNSK